jgi:hypothetical protein
MPSESRAPADSKEKTQAVMRLPFQKAITVVMIEDSGVKQAEADLAAIADGTSTVFRYGPPESYFYRLRLAAAEDPALLEKIAVFYVGVDGIIREVVIGPEYSDEALWPLGFLDAAWKMEIATKTARWNRKSPEYQHAHRARTIGEKK